MKQEILNNKGKVIETIELNDDVFGIESNESILAQYIRTFRANQRQGTSSTKDRGEVSGGGKKPWRQKGTGRARHGSTRSPIWRTGGVTHGPKPKSWNIKLSKKMKQHAIKVALSLKKNGNKVYAIDTFDYENNQKTKNVKDLLNNLKITSKTLLVVDQNNVRFRKAATNIKDVDVSLASNLNAISLLNAKNVLFSKEALDSINTKYTKVKKA